MNLLSGMKTFLGQEVEIEISGKTIFSGILIDIGLDILVIFDGKKFLYIPLMHLHNMKEKTEREIFFEPPSLKPIQMEADSISYRKTLNNAKGQFLEILVTGNRSIHGYITSVLNDYIAFYSPIYKTMFISMHHLKWLTPYQKQTTPYKLSNENLPVVPSSIPLARSYEDQLQKSVGKLVVFDMGDQPDKVGVVHAIANNIVQLITANGVPVYWKLTHLKTIHIP